MLEVKICQLELRVLNLPGHLPHCYTGYPGNRTLIGLFRLGVCPGDSSTIMPKSKYICGQFRSQLPFVRCSIMNGVRLELRLE